ncbi:MAG: hypothetical protein ACLP5H_29840 [Desulfomonilaceae bacterium]
MTKQLERNRDAVALIGAIQPVTEITILPPDAGVLGRFLKETENMLKARGMRMTGLLRRINESGQQTEALLRMAAGRMEAAQAKLEKDLAKEGLVPEPDADEEVENQDE